MAGLKVFNGVTYEPATIRVPVLPTYLTSEADTFGAGFYAPTGLRLDPNHPGMYFTDGLPPSDLGPGFYETGL